MALTQTATVDCKGQQQRGLRKMKPTVRMPNGRVLRWLSADDQVLLREILGRTAECIDNPGFRRSTPPPLPERWEELEELGDQADQDDTAREELLAPSEESALFMYYNYCRRRVMRVLRRYRHRALDAKGTRRLLYWERVARRARSVLIRANGGLVVAMAGRFRRRPIEMSELISEGNLTLVRCVDRFDASRGIRFSTYACRSILVSCARAADRAARQRTAFPASYDPELDRSDELDRQRAAIEEECVDELRAILFENAADLSDVERRVLKARFALGRKSTRRRPRHGQTLYQIGDRLGVSKERVRQIQNQALDKLRTVLDRRLPAAG